MNQSLGLSPELREYLLDRGVREHDVLRRLREKTQIMPDGIMQITPEQGAFMAMLVRLTGARRALEIGVFTGYSTLAVALALPEDGHVTACDIDPESTAIARHFWREAGVEERIDLRIGPAIETLDGLLAARGQDTYDFAFIDADKENYANYYEKCMELVRPGGLIVVDNVLWRKGWVINATAEDEETVAVRAFNSRLRDDPRIDLSMVPIGDGVTLARRRPG